jgi:hypothetical protein
MFDLKLLIEEVLLENYFVEELLKIHGDTLEATKEFEKNKKLYRGSKKDLNIAIVIYNSNRIHLRKQLQDLIKDKPVLAKGRVAKTQQDLDEYIWDKENDKLDRERLEGLIALHSSTLPSSDKYRGKL